MVGHSLFNALLIWTWVLTFAVGTVISGRALYDALADYFFLQGLGLNGPMRIEAQKGIRTELGRLFIAIFFMIIGLIALFTPDNPEAGISIKDQIISVCFVAIGVFMTVQSALDRRDRARQLALRGVPDRHGPSEPLDVTKS